MATCVIVFGAILLIVAYYIKYRLSRRRLEKLIQQFVVHPGYPIVGHIPLLFMSMPEIPEKLNKFCHTHPSPVGGWLFNKPCIMVYDSGNFKIFLNKVSRKGSVFSLIRPVLGDGLISINDKERWKQHRRLATPAFVNKLMDRQYLQVFAEENNKLVQELNKLADSTKPFSLWKFIYKSECRKICKTTMDYDIEDDKSITDFQNFTRSMSQGFRQIIMRLYQPWLHCDRIFNLYVRLNGTFRIYNRIRELPEKILANRRKQIGQTFTSLKDTKAKILLDILMSPEASTIYSDAELVDEITTFLDAGSGTTVTSVCFVLLILAMHPGYQDRVYQEIRNAIGEENNIATSEDLHKLNLLDRCVKETMRLFPPVPLILRRTQEDIMLKDSRIVPKETTVVLSIFHLHRDSTIYPNPEIWDPDRFLPEEVAKRPPYSYMPFSAGPRACIGERYALLSIKIQLVTLLQKFQFTTDLNMSDIKLDFNIALRNLTGYKMCIRRRNKIKCTHNT